MTHDSPLLPEQPKRHRVYRGLSDRQEQIFTGVAVCIVLLYIAAWTSAIIQLRRQRAAATTVEISHAADPREPVAPEQLSPTGQITGAILDSRESTAYLNDAMLGFIDPLRGESGELRYAPVLPGEQPVQPPPNGPAVTDVPDQPGIYDLAVEFNKATAAVKDLSIVTLVPRAQKRGGRIGTYYLGSWPWEGGGQPRTPKYAPPNGFIQVTRENQNFRVSEHFRLRDFLTKDQANVWPKYLLLRPELIDKLELTIQELEARGIKVEHMQVMSGFRTPRYNQSGGNVAGRAGLSRHMYGDAADVFVDNDRNGMLDDLNRDGRVDTRDTEIVSAAAERVEAKHRSLIGGIGTYAACCGHGPFTHIDVRGSRARWRGTGNG